MIAGQTALKMVGIGLLLSLLACGGEFEDAPNARTSLLRSASAFQDPLMLIGADEAQPGHILYRIRGVFRSADDRIIVGNNASSQIRVFDRTGSLIAEMGAPGAGPKEFQSLQAVLPFDGDSLIAWDPLTQRLSIWSTAGLLGRTIGVPLGSAPQVEAQLADGRLVLSTERRTRPPVRRPWVKWQDTLHISLFDPNKPAVVHELGQFPHFTKVAAQIPSGRLIGAPLPDQVGVLMDAGAEHIFVGFPDSAHVTVLDPSGKRLQEIRLEIPRRPRTKEAIEEWIEWGLRDVAAHERGGIRRYLSEYPQPEYYPAFDEMLLDSRENLWIRHYVARGDSVSRLTRLSADGNVVKEVLLPHDFRPLQIGSDWILGTLKGNYDVEIVALLPFDPT